ncbi:MAG: DUF6259 domain-containing protein [bacterium]|nr:DUF6259 domain-containing protein [bacterium]
MVKRGFILCGLSLAVAAAWAAEPFRLGDAELGFSIRLSTFGSSNRVEQSARPESMRTRTVTVAGDRTTVTWKGHPVFGAEFAVVVTLDLLEEGCWRYALSWRDNVCPLPGAEVKFPMLTVPRTDETRLFVPDHNGKILIPDWTDAKPGKCLARNRPYGIHFAAALTPRASWYVDQRGDARLESAFFELRNGTAPHQVCVSAGWEPPARASSAGELPFTGVIARLSRPSWWEATMRYAAWARRQPWVAAAKSRDFSRLRDIGFWFWNRGAAEKVISPVERFQKDSGVPCALDWYWWHDIPYDSYFPNFWPPREGEETFRAAIARCAKAGIFLQVYTNGVTWDMDDESWHEGGEEGVVRKADGSVYARAFNRFNRHRLSWMCATNTRFQDRLCGVYRKLAAAGLPGIYMDMIGCATYEPCFATDHGHVPGGGRYMADGYRAFARRVRLENPGVILSTEEPNETYLETFDAVISLQTNGERFRNADDRRVFVPAHHAVYHGAQALFGSFAMVHGVPAFDEKWPKDGKWKVEKDWKALFPDQFAIEVARGVTWGMQPMVHNFLPENADDPRYAEDYKLMVETARFYWANRDLLFDGEMLDPGELTCATHPVDFLSRSTYAREGEYKVTHRDGLESVLHSVWRAPSGRKAVILFNWTRKEQSFSLKTPDVESSGRILARSWKIVAF